MHKSGPLDCGKGKSKKHLRIECEKANGQPWPKEPNTGGNQDVSHTIPKADGGPNSLDNIEPLPHDVHVQLHKDNGDFKRWGRSTKWTELIMAVDMRTVMPANKMIGEDADESRSLQEMLHRAEAYLTSFQWCPTIDASYFGCGSGGICAVFLFKLAAKINGADDLIWVVEGDLPSAYLVTDFAPDPISAASNYCNLMDEWAMAVLNGSSLESAFPVGVEANEYNATRL